MDIADKPPGATHRDRDGRCTRCFGIILFLPHLFMGMTSPQYINRVLSKERCTLAIMLRRRLSFCKCQVSFGNMDALDLWCRGTEVELKTSV